MDNTNIPKEVEAPQEPTMSEKVEAVLNNNRIDWEIEQRINGVSSSVGEVEQFFTNIQTGGKNPSLDDIQIKLQTAFEKLAEIEAMANPHNKNSQLIKKFIEDYEKKAKKYQEIANKLNTIVW